VSAFDDVRPPQIELMDDCVHCGFCLPTCPTYVLWGEEMDSPRGRIVLMRQGHEEISAPLVEHIDRCLGCMACVTACPSGVKYDKLIEDTRPQLERNFERPAPERAYRRLVFELFTHPGRLRAAVPLVAAARRTGLAGVARTARVLAADGYEVHAPRLPRCCGALQLHSGDEGAVELAKETIAALEDYETIVVNAAGCGSAMKDYGHVLRDQPEWAERAERFAAKVRDATEVLAEAGPRAERRPLAMKVAYHDACHLAHAQGVRNEPRELLRQVPGLELIEPAEWEICCGSAGVYNLLEPEPAAELGERKARNLLDTGAEAVAAANPGCALQITTHTARLGRALPVYHPLELVARSIG
jgi:glycolate oxidase iron-sulfur subunit